MTCYSKCYKYLFFQSNEECSGFVYINDYEAKVLNELLKLM